MINKIFQGILAYLHVDGKQAVSSVCVDGGGGGGWWWNLSPDVQLF